MYSLACRYGPFGPKLFTIFERTEKWVFLAVGWLFRNLKTSQKSPVFRGAGLPRETFLCCVLSFGFRLHITKKSCLVFLQASNQRFQNKVRQSIPLSGIPRCIFSRLSIKTLVLEMFDIFCPKPRFSPSLFFFRRATRKSDLNIVLGCPKCCKNKYDYWYVSRHVVGITRMA